jgi:hypothetical protein
VNKIVRKIGIGAMTLALAVTAFASFPVLAQGSVPRVDWDSVDDVKAVLDKIIGWAFVLFFALAGVFILWAAFDYLTAKGDPKKVESAKNKLIYAAIGIAIALVARSIAGIIEAFIR